MLDTLLKIIAPHHCYGCGFIGTSLCDNCKYNINYDVFSGCIICRRPTGLDGICKSCKTTYSRAWVVGERSEVLKQLLDGYKFNREKSSHRELSSLLALTLPQLPDSTVVVSIPTISSHVRQRGHDHMKLIAAHFAKQRSLTYSPLLKRRASDVQRGASRADRMQQAKRAFTAPTQLSKDTPYLLIDDVLTTGATLQWAAQALRDARAETVWVAVVARQPLD